MVAGLPVYQVKAMQEYATGGLLTQLLRNELAKKLNANQENQTIF